MWNIGQLTMLDPVIFMSSHNAWTTIVPTNYVPAVAAKHKEQALLRDTGQTEYYGN